MRVAIESDLYCKDFLVHRLRDLLAPVPGEASLEESLGEEHQARAVEVRHLGPPTAAADEEDNVAFEQLTPQPLLDEGAQASSVSPSTRQPSGDASTTCCNPAPPASADRSLTRTGTREGQ